MRPARLMAAAALAGAAFTATPADAACVGSQTYAYVCVTANLPPVDPQGNHFSDCIHVVVPPCVAVSFDYPSVGPTSPQLLEFECGGLLMPRCPEFSLT